VKLKLRTTFHWHHETCNTGISCNNRLTPPVAARASQCRFICRPAINIAIYRSMCTQLPESTDSESDRESCIRRDLFSEFVLSE